MIGVTVMYPNTPDSNFNRAYYLNTHIPLALRRLGSAVKGTAVDQGLGGLQSGSPAPYVAVAQFLVAPRGPSLSRRVCPSARSGSDLEGQDSWRKLFEDRRDSKSGSVRSVKGARHRVAG